MNEHNCPNCKKELSMIPGNYPVASFYGPSLCNCLGEIKTFTEIEKVVTESKITQIPKPEKVA